MSEAPVAKRVSTRIEKHGHVRVDPYFWLNQRDDPEVRQHLLEENAYTERSLAHTRELQEELFQEIKGRIQPDDASVPYRREGYFYYHRYTEGQEYAVHCRRKGSLEAPEEILLDGNELARGHDYFNLRLSGTSTDQRLLAYAVDVQGRRMYTVRVKDLATGRLLDDVLPEVTGNVAWANDNRTFFYTRQHPETLRSYRVYRHRLGTSHEEDTLVYEEEDETFHLHVSRTKSKRFVMIISDQTVTSEYRFLPADEPEAEPRVLEPRRHGHEYSVSHFEDHFYILTNKDDPDYRLMRVKTSSPESAGWEEVVRPERDCVLEDFEIFREFLVLVERRAGLRQLRVMPWDGSSEHRIAFDEPSYHVYPTHNLDFETHLLRFAYTSLKTPHSTYDYDMRSRDRVLLKREEVLGGYDPESYVTERLWTEAPDGERVPVSLVYRKDTRLSGRAPLLLYGYGAYGIIIEPSFSPARVSLLDRGFVYAIAHVRGSELLGRRWYDGGRLLNKTNTFTDYIACAEDLAARGYGHPEKLFAWGGSAGGLLLGAVLNLRPELFRGVVAHVPFVDIVTTMLDDTIPLTTGEYDEWGDPNDEELYRHMLSYSPYDNIVAQDYPEVLVTAGLHDSQVQYWEPAKWVAKLRATKTDGRRVLLKMNMEAGHHGASGRFEHHRETALAYAFLLDLTESSSGLERKDT